MSNIGFNLFIYLSFNTKSSRYTLLEIVQMNDGLSKKALPYLFVISLSILLYQTLRVNLLVKLLINKSSTPASKYSLSATRV